MIHFLDRTFCSVADVCENRVGCYRHLSKDLRVRADKWALDIGMVSDEGDPEPILAWADFSASCVGFVRTKEPKKGEGI